MFDFNFSFFAVKAVYGCTACSLSLIHISDEDGCAAWELTADEAGSVVQAVILKAADNANREINFLFMFLPRSFLCGITK